MTRTRARAPRGDRAVGTAPQGHWKTLTILGALRIDGPATCVSVEAPTDGEVFRAFVDRALVPALHPGDVVVMDNLAAHKVKGVAQAIEAAGATVRYLPPYSPDLSPIEPCWSKVKEHLRSAGARDAVTLGQAVREAFAKVTAQDATAWFSQCGYGVH